ncbi:LysR family transcriptional regulator [Halomonas sp. Choline-3u-9]|nr:LysR family transcriptional regulator [Halomonas sp. MG34]PKH60266.1 LysR family transcriptional regulator [Halomonas sp. Choline-3u-9]QGQ71195.1 LysR family transcriptional regulator [Halomonas sp. PA16-9]
MLDIKYYVLIDAIATHGTVHGAAAAIGITQPAATHRIREMERRLGVALFHREGRRLTLSASGERLLETAHDVLPRLRSAELEAWQLARRTEPALRLGIGPYDTFSRALPHLYDQHERDIDLVRLSMADMTTALLTSRVDMICMIEVPSQRGIAHQLLFEEPLVAVLPPEHPYEQSDAVPAEVFDQGRHFTYSITPESGHEFEHFFQPAGVYPSHMVQIESVALILELVAAGKGVSILSRWAVQDAHHAGRVVMRPLAGNLLRIPWYLAYAQTPRITAVAEPLAATLRHLYRTDV